MQGKFPEKIVSREISSKSQEKPQILSKFACITFAQYCKDDVIRFLFLFYVKQIKFTLLCVCPEIDHRGHQNAVGKSVTHSPNSSCVTKL